MMTPFNPYMMNDVTKVKPKKKKRGRKRKREIPPPKKAMSAYNVFFKETRVKLLEEFEKITFEQLGKEVGKRWHKLSTKERVPYQKRSRLDKERFKKEMEEYKVKLALKEKMMEQNKINMLRSSQQHMYPMNLLLHTSHPSFLHVPSPTMTFPYPQQHIGYIMKRVESSSQQQQLYPNSSYLPPPPSHDQRQTLSKIPKIMIQNNSTKLIEVSSAIDCNIHGNILATKSHPVAVEASDVSQVPRTPPVLVEATGSTVSSGSEDISPRGSEDISPRFDEEGGDDLRDPALT